MQLLAVNYHYFREEKPKSGIYPLTIKEFERQLDEISKYYDFISEDMILDIIDRKKRIDKKFCLLTFDDGLKEQMNIADLLLKKGIPGIFYVSTGAIKENIVLDVHKLHYIRSIVEDEHIYEILDKEYDISSYSFDKSFLKNQYRYDTLLSSEVKYFLNFVLNSEQKNKIVDILFSELVSDEYDFSKKLYMNEDDLIKLANSSMLGTRADSHLPLSTLHETEIKYDIKQSIKYLESVVGKSIKSISYPYGGRSAVSQNVADIAKKCGLKFGLTMWRGLNNNNDLDKQFLLKRIDTNDAPGGKLNSREYCI